MKFNKKVVFFIFTVIFIVGLLGNISYGAASVSLTASKTEISVGEAITIVAAISNTETWNLELTSNGGSLNGITTSTDANGSETSKDVISCIFSSNEVGEYKIVLSGSVAGSDLQKQNVTKEIKINVKAKEVEQPKEEQKPATTTSETQKETPKQEEPDFTPTNKTMYSSSGINLRASWSTESARTYIEKGTELNVTATSTKRVNNYVWYRVSYNGQTKYIASGLLTNTKPEENKDEDKDDKKEKSTNKALKGLVVENHKLSPEFDPETTKYTLEVTKDVEKLEITPILQDDKSKFEITGNENFKVGNNIVKITVTAEDGTNRIYTITVTKTNEDGTENPLDNMLKLKKLQIKDIKLDPEFNPETTNYSILVSDPSSIKIADITAVAEDEDVEVTIAEAEADKNGNRVITIMLENKEGDRSGVYQVTIKKGVSAISELQRNKNNRIYFILGGIIGILAIAIIVVIILLKKTSDDGDDYDDIKDADELSDDYDYALKREIDIAKSEEAPEFDEIIEDSNVKSQILSNQDDYNAFEDKENDVKESNTGVSEETKRYDFNGEDEEEDFKIKGKKKGKHF